MFSMRTFAAQITSAFAVLCTARLKDSSNPNTSEPKQKAILLDGFHFGRGITTCQVTVVFAAQISTLKT